MAISRGDLTEAAELAKRAEIAHPGATWLRQERTQLAVRTGSWREALLLTQDEAPRAGAGVLLPPTRRPIPRRAGKLAKQAWKRDPGLVPAAIAYARRLRMSGHEKAAQDVLRRSWAKTPHPELAEFALQGRPGQAGAAAHRHRAGARPARSSGKPPAARTPCRSRPACLAKPRRHAEAAVAGGLNQRRVHMLAADIAESEGNDPAHREAQRDALRQAAMADPRSPAGVARYAVPRTTRGTRACGVCHTAGRIAWSAPAAGPGRSVVAVSP